MLKMVSTMQVLFREVSGLEKSGVLKVVLSIVWKRCSGGILNLVTKLLFPFQKWWRNHHAGRKLCHFQTTYYIGP
jgi:hypothetical protein